MFSFMLLPWGKGLKAAPSVRRQEERDQAQVQRPAPCAKRPGEQAQVQRPAPSAQENKFKCSALRPAPSAEKIKTKSFSYGIRGGLLFVIARYEAIYDFCHCERSEAIHVNECTPLIVDCRVAALLAMTGGR